MTGRAVRVRVPATSANLGPAFDCAGLALHLHDEVEVSLTPGGLEVVMEGEGADTLPTDASHLVVRAFHTACDRLGWEPPGLRVAARNRIPQGKGLGSSAAAVVAGVLAAFALCPTAERDDDAVLALVSELEGHPDNVAACLLGGATLSWTAAGTDDGRGARAVRLDVDPRVLAVVVVPEATLSTHVARALLPPAVPHADAACAAGRAALLVHALTREPELLVEATVDRLHQRQRGEAMPGSIALLDRLRDAGHAAVVSGAGPSLLVLGARTADDPAGAVEGTAVARSVAACTPPGWRVHPLPVDPSGARVLWV